MVKDKIFIVPARFSGERLQSVLKQELGEAYSGKRIKQMIDCYRCRVNGKIEKFASYKVNRGDRIQLDLAEESPQQACRSPTIFYEDVDLLIWNKPMQTVSDLETMQELFAPQKVYLVHRLDKDTTGVMILAKNIAMQKILAELFKKREIEKTYEAIVQGRAPTDTFTVENKIGKIAQYAGQAVWGKTEDGVYARTDFEIIKMKNSHLLVKCRPHTGRTHQIRSHLAEMQLPVLGDYHYARTTVFQYPARRFLLHASSVSFIHPKQQKEITIKAPYPEDFRKAVDELF
jgi:RluA family pseudouridine synthase